MALVHSNEKLDEPSSFEEAYKRKEWQEAMTEEYNFILHNDIWQDCIKTYRETSE